MEKEKKGKNGKRCSLSSKGEHSTIERFVFKEIIVR